MLYIKLQKLPAPILAVYHRSVFKTYRVECVEVLREWVIQEAEFHSRALETVQGLTIQNLENQKPNLPVTENHKDHTEFRLEPTNDSQGQGQGYRSCRVCGRSH